jgi:RND family efflux transporter MFP subunit
MPFRSAVNHAASGTLCVAALLLSGCSGGKAAAPPPPPPTVEVATVIERDTPIYSDWIATLDGYVNAEIQPRVSGYIVKQNYKEGAVVRKGEVLFEIDPRPWQAALDQAKAQVAQAEAALGKASVDVERDTPLAAARAIAQSQLDTELHAKLGAQASVLAAKANLEQAELNLEFTRVTSLVTGIAGAARVQIGNLVGPSSILTSISQVDPIKAYFTVSEQVFIDFHRRFPTQASVEEQRRRMPLQLVLGDGSIYEHIGTISFADREINPATGTIRVAGLFPNPNNLLRPGGYGRVRVSTRTVTGAMLIPQRAVTELQGSYQVSVVGSDNKVSTRSVTVADRVGNLWIVTDGLKAGERVIVEGLLKARDGAVVNVVAAKSPQTGG